MKTSLGDVSVQGLLRLARNNAATTRRTYVALGAELAESGSANVTLTDWQRSILSQLLRQVVGDIYASLRWLVLAEMGDGTEPGSTASPSLPADVETRVFSLMSECGSLRDVSLIEAVTHRLYQHQLEQATRPPDTNRWTNEPSLDNPGDFFAQPVPEFSPVNRRLAAYGIDRSRRTDRYGNPVLLPGEIEPSLYERLHWRVAAALRHTLIDGSGQNCEQLDSRIEKACFETIRHSLAIAAAPTSSTEAALALEAASLLTVETVHRLLKAGEISLFEQCFTRLAGIRPVILRRLVYEDGGDCLAILARSLEVDLDQALSIFVLIRSGRTKQFREINGENTPFKAVYSAVSVDVAKSVRSHWARRPEFSSALRDAADSQPHDVRMRRN